MYNEVDLIRLDIITECPHCGSKNNKRIGLTTTLANSSSFDDAQGHHEHDTNKISATYCCDKNHNFDIIPLNSCWCGWKQK